MDKDNTQDLLNHLNMAVPADALEKCRSPAALKVLLDGLAEHYFPKVCQYALLGSIVRLLHPEGGLDANARFVFAHPTVLDAFIGWLTAPRTRAEMNSFLLALECSCHVPGLPLLHRQLHVVGRRRCPPGSGQKPIDDLVETLSFQLMLILRVLKPEKFKFYKVSCSWEQPVRTL
jgi:hypothetical protein